MFELDCLIPGTWYYFVDNITVVIIILSVATITYDILLIWTWQTGSIWLVDKLVYYKITAYNGDTTRAYVREN